MLPALKNKHKYIKENVNVEIKCKLFSIYDKFVEPILDDDILYILGGVFGPAFLNQWLGFSIYNTAIDYYAEVHTTMLNKIIHVIFMPVTIYGLLLGGSSFLELDENKSLKFHCRMLLFYGWHYLLIDNYVAFKFVIVYGIVIMAVAWNYCDDKKALKENARKGLCIFIGSLAIQEVIGHWLSGDGASRLEGIPNAILYAPYFSVNPRL